MRTLPLPTTFRTREVSKIMSNLSAGDSCSVVGIGSVGKSNLMRFLLQEDVRRARLGADWEKYLFVNIDLNKLIEPTAWGLWELMLHQLRIALYQRDTEDAVIRVINEWHSDALDPTTQYIALRNLDLAVSAICDTLDLNLVFLLDDFDDLCQSLPPRVFTFLRALRDDHKYRLMYVVATRAELIRLRKDSEEIEAFEELVTPNTVWLTAYTEPDALLMLQRLAARFNTKLDERSIHDLLATTGGHPGLLRAGFLLAWDKPADLLGTLVADQRIQDECGRIWRSLTRDEQQALTDLAHGIETHRLSASTIQQLHIKGLLGGSWAAPEQIFSSLLAEYICRLQPLIGARIYVDRKKHLVIVDNNRVENLAPLEYNLIVYLDDKRGQVCSQDEIFSYLYPDEVLREGVKDNRLDSIVKRLRKEIEPDPDHPRFIVRVRGHGIKLVDGESTKGEPSDS